MVTTMTTLDKLTSQLDEHKKDYEHYQRLIPNAIEAKQNAINEGRTLVANSIDHRVKFFREKSTQLKKQIEKIESEIKAIEKDSIDWSPSDVLSEVTQ